MTLTIQVREFEIKIITWSHLTMHFCVRSFYGFKQLALKKTSTLWQKSLGNLWTHWMRVDTYRFIARFEGVGTFDFWMSKNEISPHFILTKPYWTKEFSKKKEQNKTLSGTRFLDVSLPTILRKVSRKRSLWVRVLLLKASCIARIFCSKVKGISQCLSWSILEPTRAVSGVRIWSNQYLVG